ncbi:inhibitor of Bruton tyrosine kinase [Hetaerina americana]|uniref:inhibitor of Bruton tyrosine kinase n=1 Tax=Hetaerina americana TaxID=62018 RepID=UPI003A7F4755
MSKVKYDRNEGFCSRRCRSVEHADEIASAILRGNEDQAIAFMCWRCSNFSRVIDEDGRTPLHIAASCGKTKVLEWLLKNLDNESCINAKDYESGYTPLHRSLFHGHLSAARCLIMHGAKLTSLDNDGLMPLDHVMKDSPCVGTCSSAVPCEVFVWGSNRNFNLGIGNNENRRLPDTIEYFRRKSISINQVAMGKFHSIFVSSDGRVFACGHGKGRLGLNSEETVMTPKQIPLPPNHEAGKVLDTRYVVVSATVGQDHSLLLTATGSVYAFGMNAHYQLGLDPPPPVQHTPKLVLNLPTFLIGIKAARYHSVAWSSSQVYTWGSNHGQLGHSRDDEWVLTPRKISHLRGGNFVTVSAGDSATVVGSSRGDIFVLQDYLCRKIGNVHGIPRRIEVVGGRLDPTLIKSEDVSGWGDFRSGGDELYILMLNEAKKLMLWWSSSGHFTRCDLHLGSRLINAVDIALGTDKLLVVTEEGEGFETDFKIKKRREDVMSTASQQTALQKLVDKDKSLDFYMKKIMFIHRANSVFCSPKSLNFSIIQLHPNSLTKRPEAERILGLEGDLSCLLEEAEESDCICDVVFCVQDVRIPAHRYILESNSECLASLIESAGKAQASLLPQQSDMEMCVNNCPKKHSCVTVTVDGINAVVFKEILKFVYTGACDLCMPEQWSCEKDHEYSCFALRMKGQSWKDLAKVSDVNGGNVCESQAGVKAAKGRHKRINGSDDSEFNPVSDAQRAAARFKLDYLSKLLDGLQYNKSKCSIQRKGNTSNSDEKIHPKISLSPYNCAHLYDVVIECEGEKIINAHKCVLAMRSKYFETMFKGDWIECSGLKNITLPFSYEVMQAIILYLYQNKVPALNKSDDLSYIWNVLITSDQILLEGLKETCEILLANHITLKNVSEFYQISDTYNANKLKQFCLEYMCTNLSALLECRALDDIDPELFDDLQLHYWGTRPVVLKRHISIPCEYPDLATLQSVFEVIGIPSQEEYVQHSESALRKEAVEGSKRSRGKRKQKQRPISVDECAGHLRRISLGSSSGLENEINGDKVELPLTELDICEPFDECVRVPSQDQPEKDSTHPNEESSRTKNDSLPVSQEHSSSFGTVPEKRMSSVREEDFPRLSCDSNQASVSSSAKAPKNRKMTKLSQKERKKKLISSLSMPKSVENEDIVSKPEVNPWGRLNSSFQEGSPVQLESPSLSEIMSEERRRRPPPCRRQHHDECTGEDSPWPAMRNLSMECSPSSPPTDGGQSAGWVTSPTSAENQAMGPKPFSEIIADELKQREMTKKMMEKPLDFTLTEDVAIKELQMSYEREHEHDERITVRRITSTQVSKPVWPNSKNV